MITINATFELDKEDLERFESWFRQNIKVIDFRLLQDTKELLKTNSHFKKLVKRKRDLNLEIDRFINENNI